LPSCCRERVIAGDRNISTSEERKATGQGKETIEAGRTNVGEKKKQI